jgi:two-component system, OmpR family, sensor histidine kinase MtrB
MAIFVLGAIALSVFLAAAAYAFTRSSVLAERERSAIGQTYRNADIARTELAAGNSTAQDVIERLQALGVQRLALYYESTWSAPTPKYGPDAIPVDLRDQVAIDEVAAQQIVRIDDEVVLIVGVPLPSSQAAYFDFVSLDDTEATLRNVGLSLLFGGIITTMLGGLLGAFAATRAVRPLGAATQAAKSIASGRLDTRLETSDDPDLMVLANAFNDMAAALQVRVERDARFASDVSHELRSPLMTLAASVEVMKARREEMPERAQLALDLLVADVARFQGLVEDLLEISRFDAGAIHLNLEDLLVAEFVRAAVGVSAQPDAPITVSPRAEAMIIRGDRRRLARVVANLIDNARLHGGGSPEISVVEADAEGEPLGHVWIAVEDHGPGVPLDERSLIFERFARGAVAGRRSSSDGAGLGLALVEEHLRMHGGRVWVEDRTDGASGARFVLELPADEVG